MFLEPIFSIQQKYDKGILSKLLNKSEQKDHIIMKIQEKAMNDDFMALYLVSLNRSIFDQEITSINDFKLNAIGEIIEIMSNGEGDTEFQNQVLNYLMQVKDQDFLIYVLDSMLDYKKNFFIKNIQAFISTLSMVLKSSKLNNKQKKSLMDVIYKHFLNVEIELQETLIRMMEILKIVDIYKTAELFNKADQSVKKRLIDTIKNNITFKKASEIIGSINTIDFSSDIDDSYALLFIIAIEKYRLYETINTIVELKERKTVWKDIVNTLDELSHENLIDQDKFLKLVEIASS